MPPTKSKRFWKSSKKSFQRKFKMLNAEQGKKLIDVAREVVWAKIKDKSYIVSSAEKAAFSDPRFPPVDEEEFSSISFEISVLSRPKMIMVRNPEEYLKLVHIGRDGLIVKGVWEYGILLPQVA